VSSHRWRFGVFDLDRDSRELRRAGLPVRVQPQALRVLMALLERPGEIVSRDELRSALWGEHTFVSFDRSLNFCLSRLRGALRDDARCPRFIETVAGRGYRFIAPVTSEALAPRPPDAAPAPPPSRFPHRRGPVTAALAAVLFVALPIAPGPPKPDAHAQALYAEARGLCGPAGWRRSVRLYRAACAREPRFAAAYAGMAESYLALGEDGWLEPGQAYPAAREAARRALSLEDRADARLVLGRVLLAYDWDWPGAERELRRALALEPSAPRAWASWARYLSARGDHPAAIRAAEHAEALDPASPEAVEESAWCYYRGRRFDDAARQFGVLAARRPEDAHHRRFGIFLLAGRHDDAMREARVVMRKAGVHDADIIALGSLESTRAAEAYLRGTVAFLSQELGDQRVAPERFALLHAALGERPDALAWLSRAADERSPGLVAVLMDPLLDPLRAEPAFVRVVQRVGATGAAARGL
jgi:DNA-binding winged helix-turn-helix (wHTH) protein/tetratricopeptide (TPR) repeat protein